MDVDDFPSGVDDQQPEPSWQDTCSYDGVTEKCHPLPEYHQPTENLDTCVCGYTFGDSQWFDNPHCPYTASQVHEPGVPMVQNLDGAIVTFSQRFETPSLYEQPPHPPETHPVDVEPHPLFDLYTAFPSDMSGQSADTKPSDLHSSAPNTQGDRCAPGAHNLIFDRSVTRSSTKKETDSARIKTMRAMQEAGESRANRTKLITCRNCKWSVFPMGGFDRKTCEETRVTGRELEGFSEGRVSRSGKPKKGVYRPHTAKLLRETTMDTRGTVTDTQMPPVTGLVFQCVDCLAETKPMGLTISPSEREWFLKAEKPTIPLHWRNGKDATVKLEESTDGTSAG